MTWRILLIAFVAIGGYVGWIFLDEWMAQQAWASVIDGNWQASAYGWKTLTFVWPVGLAGMVIGLMFSPIAALLVKTAEKQDHLETVQYLKKMRKEADDRACLAEAKAIAKYKARTEAAEKRADKAEHTALEKYQEERAELVKKSRNLQKQEQSLQAREDKLEEIAEQVNVQHQKTLEIAEEAEQEKRLAYKRRDNAKGEAERYRRKSKRLEAKLQSVAAPSMDY